MAAKTVTIREPIWKTRSVGIRDSACKGDGVRVKITDKDRNGKEMFPGTYWADIDLLRKAPLAKSGTVLVRMVRIEEMIHITPKVASREEQLEIPF